MIGNVFGNDDSDSSTPKEFEAGDEEKSNELLAQAKGLHMEGKVKVAGKVRSVSRIRLTSCLFVLHFIGLSQKQLAPNNKAEKIHPGLAITAPEREDDDPEPTLRGVNHLPTVEKQDRGLQAVCSQGWIECSNGDVVGGTQSCFAACNGNCCQGIDSTSATVDTCVGFTGKVCPDGSCSDTDPQPLITDFAGNPLSYSGTCEDANVGEVSGPSCVGNQGE